MSPTSRGRCVGRRCGPGRREVAIVLFNLGGPDRPESVRPFLLNLFRDPAILRVPFFVRPFLARLIARRRLAPATENYALLGGKSPLLELTQAQGSALESALSWRWKRSASSPCAHGHPLSVAIARDVKAWEPDEVILLPLYPQFSTTTTASSLQEWRDAASRVGLIAPVTTLCCWFDDPAFIAATAAPIRRALEQARSTMPAGTRRCVCCVLSPRPTRDHRQTEAIPTNGR